MAAADTLTRTTPAATRCSHERPCPAADAVDHLAARVISTQPGQGWSLLCNGVILFDDTGDLLPGGSAIEPHRRPARHSATDVTGWTARPPARGHRAPARAWLA